MVKKSKSKSSLKSLRKQLQSLRKRLRRRPRFRRRRRYRRFRRRRYRRGYRRYRGRSRRVTPAFTWEEVPGMNVETPDRPYARETPSTGYTTGPSTAGGAGEFVSPGVVRFRPVPAVRSGVASVAPAPPLTVNNNVGAAASSGHSAEPSRLGQERRLAAEKRSLAALDLAASPMLFSPPNLHKARRRSPYYDNLYTPSSAVVPVSSVRGVAPSTPEIRVWSHHPDGRPVTEGETTAFINLLNDFIAADIPEDRRPLLRHPPPPTPDIADAVTRAAEQDEIDAWMAANL